MFELKSNEQNTVKQRYWTAETKMNLLPSFIIYVLKNDNQLKSFCCIFF